MKAFTIKTLFFLLMIPVCLTAQQAMSFDFAAVSNRTNMTTGLNISSFYHFNEHLTAGIEVNRFFPVNRVVSGEDVQLSAWDLDLNFHYLVPVSKVCKFYPLAGFGHSSEKELNIKTNIASLDQFWAINTGAGLLWQFGKWAPHIEYNFSWAKTNQQLLVAGLSYELEWGSHKKEKE